MTLLCFQDVSEQLITGYSFLMSSFQDVSEQLITGYSFLTSKTFLVDDSCGMGGGGGVRVVQVIFGDSL